MDKAVQRAEEFEIVLNRERCYNRSVAGMKWFPKSNVIALDISELNFAKSHPENPKLCS